ncbi:hypothetical protein AYO38_01795 [bacterium SCGC AG-212-C10]|nr:hypothetical protein AYO38_01795 [bacterium SCGC AG-212-C10]
MAYGYQAFISYSHAADGKLAPALQSALQGFACPWYRRRAIRVFRDEASLSASPALWHSIASALDQSAYFILLASPGAAASPWVQREVAYWLEHRSADSILIACTEGTVAWDDRARDFDWQRSTAIPPNLKGAFAEEPRYIDLRWATDDMRLTLKHPQFLDAVADIAAPLHGKAKDEMVGEGIRQQRRNARWAWAAASTLVVLTIAATAAAGIALQQRSEARSQRAAAVRNADRAVAAEAVAVSRQLAAQSGANLGGSPDVALLQAVEARNVVQTNEADHSIFAAINQFAIPGAVIAGSRSLGTVAFSPDGKFLALSGPGSNALDIRDGVTGASIRELEAPGPVSQVAFSPSGKVMASVGFDDSVVFWDVATWVRAGDAVGGGGSGAGGRIAFSADGSLLASAGPSGTLRLWDAATHALVRELPVPGATSVRDMAFSPDGRSLAVATRSIVIWDLATFRPVATAGGEGGSRDELYRVQYSPDGRWLAATGPTGFTYLWSTSRLSSEPSQLGSLAQGVPVVAFSRDSSLLATASDDGTIVLWDPTRPFDPGKTVAGTTQRVASLAFSPVAAVLAAGGYSGNLTLWDINVPSPTQTVATANEGATSIAVSPRGASVIATGLKPAVAAWNPDAASTELTVIDSQADEANAAAFSTDGKILATASGAGAITLRDGATLQVVAEFSRGDGTFASQLAFSADGRLLAAVNTDGIVMLWTMDAQHRGTPLNDVSNKLWTIAAAPEGQSMATIDGSAGVQIWDLQRRTRTGALTAPGGARATSLAFRDGSTLAVGYGDGSVVLWDVGTASPITEPLRTGTDSIGALAFQPGTGRLAVSASRPTESGLGVDTVTLWDVETRFVIGTLRTGVAMITGLAFTADGRSLFASSARGEVLRWSTSAEDWQATACGLLRRNFTQHEWRLFRGDVPYRNTCPGLPAGE